MRNQSTLVIKVAGGVPLVLSALYATLSTLSCIVLLFKVSLATGVALFLTGIGFVYFVPVYMAWGGMAWLSQLCEETLHGWAYWRNLILGFLGVLILPYVVLFIIQFIAWLLVKYV